MVVWMEREREGGEGIHDLFIQLSMLPVTSGTSGSAIDDVLYRELRVFRQVSCQGLALGLALGDV